MKIKVDFSIPRVDQRFLKAASDWLLFIFVALVLFCCAPFLPAQSCQTSSELDDSMRSALTAAGQRYFDMVAKGDVASLRQNSIPSLASDFSHIESIVTSSKAALAGAQGNVKSVFVLEAEGSAPLPDAQFYCGVFGKNGQTSNSAVFSLHQLPIGKYSVVLLDTTSAQARTSVSLVLQQLGTDWKLGGLYIKAAQSAAHDSQWFLARAHEYKAKGQMHNAWLYAWEARSLISPLPFMSTRATDDLYDEAQSLLPADFPADGKTVDLPAGSTIYKVISVYLEPAENDIDVAVKYQAADISNQAQVSQNNIAVSKALVAKYPELKDAFSGVIARAVDPSGHDYGTLEQMKDIK